MTHIFKQIFNVLACGVVLATIGATALAGTNETNIAIAAAFEALRQGDASQTGALVRYGDEAIEAIARYLDDTDERVRTEAVAVLAAIGGSKSTIALVDVLDDKASAIQDKAAFAVLAHALQYGISDLPALSPKLVAGASVNKPNASALLLLGYVSDGDDVLQGALSETRLVKLNQAGIAVPANLPAGIALSRRGDDRARNWLEKKISNGDAATVDFLLDVLGVIDAPVLLVALASVSLADDRPWRGGIPSGGEPSLRVMDKAVGAFVQRLALETEFELSDLTRYSPEQIDMVRKLIFDSLPN